MIGSSRRSPVLHVSFRKNTTNEEPRSLLNSPNIIGDITLRELYSITSSHLVQQKSSSTTAKMLIGGAVSYVAGSQAVRTVYWRTTTKGRLLKTAKTCMFQGPPRPRTAASGFSAQSRMDGFSKNVLDSKS